jgi:hypothetical protein
MKSVQNYSGTFAKDNLPPKMLKSNSAIINFDNTGYPGTHWVAVFNDPNSEYVDYFDSFGLPPPNEIENYLQTSSKPILYNTKQVQSLSSSECGKLCINFIKRRSEGISAYDIIHH